ncbi:MAG: hypothetical protein KF729_26270 [Sandaracinaceae bacterium]|nr:hypothetical protein [Sandaracinaceae bacterium]
MSPVTLRRLAASLLLAACSAQRPADGGAADAAPDAPALSASLRYCNCLLIQCHEAFHLEFGETDFDALRNCEASAESLLRDGSGLACREQACAAASHDAAECAAALGAAPCD